MGRKSHTTGGARAASREQVEAQDESNTGLWDKMRKHFSKAVQARVDLVADAGGLTLHDIELLEFAAHEQAHERIKRLERKAKTATAVMGLEQLRLQCRKHLRTLRIAINPIANPDVNKHPDAEAELRKQRSRERIAGESVTRATTTDTGDELVN